MSSIDPAVAAVLDSRNPTATDSDDEDALIASLEDDDDQDLRALREQRIQQLHSEVTRAKEMRESGTGQYTEIKDEKGVMDITTGTKLVVVHFFKSDFGRCGVMDRHIEELAPRHFDTRFLKVNVDNAPFLVTKLKIQVLPCVISFIDGIGVDRIIGFEGLGNGDNFTTKDLESRLLSSRVLVRSKMSNSHGIGNPLGWGTRDKSEQTRVEDDDEEWE